MNSWAKAKCVLEILCWQEWDGWMGGQFKNIMPLVPSGARIWQPEASPSLPPSGIQQEYQGTQEGVAMGGQLAVMLSSMKTPSAVQTQQHSDEQRS